MKNLPISAKSEEEGSSAGRFGAAALVYDAVLEASRRFKRRVRGARAHHGRAGHHAPAILGGAVIISFAMRIRLEAAATYCAAACVRSTPR